MIRLGHIAAIALMVLGFGHRTVAQGFVSNCTWKTARMYGSYLGMYCHNDNWRDFSYGWTWFNTAYCVINNGGYLASYNYGNYIATCRDCYFRGSKTDFLLSCTCYDVDGTTNPAAFDLNKVIWNHNGFLGCYDHIGNYTQTCIMKDREKGMNVDANQVHKRCNSEPIVMAG